MPGVIIVYLSITFFTSDQSSSILLPINVSFTIVTLQVNHRYRLYSCYGVSALFSSILDN